MIPHATVYNWLHILQLAIYPPTCVFCGAAGDRKDDLCSACHDDLILNTYSCPRCAEPLQEPPSSPCGHCQRHPPHFDTTFAPFHYAEPLKTLLLELKFNQRLQHARLLGNLFSERVLKAAVELPDYIIPVPLHAARLRERGYNQALELARFSGRRLGLPVASHLVVRGRATKMQSRLRTRERQRNVRDAFELRGNVAGLRIALLDDVMTTGSTLSELSRILKRGGAASVVAWSVARAGNN